LCFLLLLLVNNFELELPKRKKLRQFKPHEFSTNETLDISEGTSYTNNFGLLSLFIERGQYTNFPYQLPMNHRDINLVILHYGIEGKPPMLESMVRPRDGAEKFDQSTKISFFFHALKDTSRANGSGESDKDGLPGGLISRDVLDTNDASKKELLRTQCYVKADGENEEKVHGYGYIQDREAIFLEFGDFERLLEIFGFEWVDENGVAVQSEEVTVSVIMSFIELFEGYRFDTVDGFKDFLKDFGMDDYYRYQEGVDLAKQYRDFGMLLRSITNVRLGTYDGQHRMFLMMLFFTGFFDITDQCPLTHEPMKKCAHYKDYKTWQLWEKMQFSVGVRAKPTLRMPTVLANLRRRGKELTAAQSYYIPVNAISLIRKLTVTFNGSLHGGSALTPLTFKNYWKQDSGLEIPSANLQLTWTILKNEMEQNSQIVINALLPKILKPEAWKKQVETSEIRYLDITKWAAWPPGSQVKDFAKELGYTLLLLKLGASSGNALKALNSFFGMQSPKHPQNRPLDAIGVARYHSINWIKTYVLDTLWTVDQKYTSNRLRMEQEIVKFVKKFPKWMEKENRSGEYQWDNFGDTKVELPESGQKLDGGLLRAKIQYAICLNVFEEIFWCIDYYGLDPKLGDGIANSSLKAYTQ